MRGNAKRERKIPSFFGTDEIRFRMCVSARSFRIFVALVIGWVLTVGNHTVSQVIPTTRLHGSRHFATICLFLGKGQRNADTVSYCLFRILEKTLIAEGIEIRVVLDDTLNKHSGPRMCGAGWQHDGSAPKHTIRKGTDRNSGAVLPCWSYWTATGGGIPWLSPKRCPWGVPPHRMQAKPSSR